MPWLSGHAHDERDHRGEILQGSEAGQSGNDYVLRWAGIMETIGMLGLGQSVVDQRSGVCCPGFL